MGFPLTSLPPEIVTYHLLKLLSPEDILSLSRCIPLRITEKLYNLSFHDGTHFDHYDVQMFRERARARLYVFGDDLALRLGIALDESQTLEKVASPFEANETFLRMNTPRRVESVNGSLAQASAGGCSIRLINSKAELYFTGRYQHGYFEMVDKAWQQLVDVKDSFECSNFGGSGPVNMVHARQFVPDDFTKEDLDFESVDDSLCPGKLELCSSAKLEPTAFVRVCSATNIFLALDSAGLIWKWYVRQHGMQGIPMILAEPGRKPRLIPGTVLQIRVGLSGTACLVENWGIVILGKRQAANGWRGGYPCHNGHICLVEAFTVPETAHGVEDFVVIGNTLLYLKTDGSVTAVGIEDVSVGEIPQQPIAAICPQCTGKFTQIAGSDLRFALLSKCGHIIVGRLSYSRPQFRITIDALDTSGSIAVASLAVGNEHCLILTKSGEVYAWGKEHEFNGCLGLGTFAQATSLDGVSTELRDDEPYLVLQKPRAIKLPGKAYGVFAGNDYSGVLLYTGEEMSPCKRQRLK